MKQRISFCVLTQGIEIGIYKHLITMRISSFLLIIFGLVFALKTSAQNPILPLPNNQYIYFDGIGNQSMIKNLPIHDFQMSDGTTLIPTDENMLQAAYEENNELFLYYRGQPAKFCQSIVPDINGNILFFIVDNNIYNKNGEPFINSAKVDFINNYYPDDIYSSLLNGYIEGNTSHSNYFSNFPLIGGNESLLNRFNISANQEVLDPNLIIFPLSGNCNEFLLIFYIQNYATTAVGIKPEVIIRKIKILDDNTMYLFPAKLLLRQENATTLCNNNNRVSIVLSNKNIDNEHLLFVKFWDELFIYKADINLYETPAFKKYFLGYVSLDQGHFRAEMELNYISNLNMNLLCVPIISYPTQNILYRLFLFPVNFNDIPVQTYTGTESYYNVTYPIQSNYFQISFTQDNVPKGMEFSPDGNVIYFSYTNPGSLKYLKNPQDYIYNGNPSDLTNYLGEVLGLDSDYQYSEIEKGSDENLYIPFINEANNTSGITRIRNCNNPDNLTIEENIYTGANCYFSNNYGIFNSLSNLKLLLLSRQIDNFNWQEYYNSIPQECCHQLYRYNEINPDQFN